MILHRKYRNFILRYFEILIYSSSTQKNNLYVDPAVDELRDVWGVLLAFYIQITILNFQCLKLTEDCKYNSCEFDTPSEKSLRSGR